MPSPRTAARLALGALLALPTLATAQATKAAVGSRAGAKAAPAELPLKHAGKPTSTPIRATLRTPSLSVKRPTKGRIGSVSNIVTPISANCARDQPNSLIRCGAKMLLV